MKTYSKPKDFRVSLWVNGFLVCHGIVRAQSRDEAIFQVGVDHGQLAPTAQMQFDGHEVKFLVTVVTAE